MMGVDLLNQEAVASRGEIFGDVYTHDVMRPDEPVASLKFRWCIRGRWKLIVPHYPNILDAELKLYDLHADPEENTNLATSRPDLVRQLCRKVQNWWPVE